MNRILKSTKGFFIVRVLFAILLGVFIVSIANYYSYSYLDEKCYVFMPLTVLFNNNFNNFNYSNLFLDDVRMIFKNLIAFFVTYSLILLVFNIPILIIFKILLGQFIFTYIHFYPSNYYTIKIKILGVWIPFIISQLYYIAHECSMTNAILTGFIASFIMFNLIIFVHKKSSYF